MGSNEELTKRMEEALKARAAGKKPIAPELKPTTSTAVRVEDTSDPVYFTQKEAMALMGVVPLNGALVELQAQATRIAETLFLYKDQYHVYTHDKMEEILAGKQDLTVEGMRLNPEMSKDITAVKDYKFILGAIDALAKQGAIAQAKYKKALAAAKEKQEPLPPAPKPLDFAGHEGFITLGKDVYPTDLFKRDFIKQVVATLNNRLQNSEVLRMAGETIQLDVSVKPVKSR